MAHTEPVAGITMSNAPGTELEAWESEGGALERSDPIRASLGDKESQLEWAVRIKHQTDQEFDRVAAAFRVVVHRKKARPRSQIGTVITILEEKCSQVMRNEEAGYFIRGWQDIDEQE